MYPSKHVALCGGRERGGSIRSWRGVVDSTRVVFSYRFGGVITRDNYRSSVFFWLMDNQST